MEQTAYTNCGNKISQQHTSLFSVIKVKYLSDKSARQAGITAKCFNIFVKVAPIYWFPFDSISRHLFVLRIITLLYTFFQSIFPPSSPPPPTFDVFGTFCRTKRQKYSVQQTSFQLQLPRERSNRFVTRELKTVFRSHSCVLWFIVVQVQKVHTKRRCKHSICPLHAVTFLESIIILFVRCMVYTIYVH